MTAQPELQCPIEGCDWRPDVSEPVRESMRRVFAETDSGDSDAAVNLGVALAHYAQAHPLMDWVCEVGRLHVEIRRLTGAATFGL